MYLLPFFFFLEEEPNCILVPHTCAHIDNYKTTSITKLYFKKSMSPITKLFEIVHIYRY